MGDPKDDNHKNGGNTDLPYLNKNRIFIIKVLKEK